MKECENENKEEDSDALGCSVNANGGVHVVGGKEAVILTNVRFIEQLTEVGMRTAEAAAQDASKGGFWIATVGRGVTRAILGYELQQGKPA